MHIVKVHTLKRQNRVIVLWTSKSLYVCDLLTRKAATYIDIEGMSTVTWEECSEGFVLAAYNVGRNRFSYYDVSGEGNWEQDVFGTHDTLLQVVDQRSEDENELMSDAPEELSKPVSIYHHMKEDPFAPV